MIECCLFPHTITVRYVYSVLLPPWNLSLLQFRRKNSNFLLNGQAREEARDLISRRSAILGISWCALLPRLGRSLAMVYPLELKLANQESSYSSFLRS